MHNYILTIDTSKQNRTCVVLKSNSKTYKKEVLNKAQSTLILINDLFKENNLTFADIKEIKVNTVSESLVGGRIGVTIANILGYLLNTKVNSKHAYIKSDYKHE